MIRRPPRSPLFPSTPLSRSERAVIPARGDAAVNLARLEDKAPSFAERDDHVQIHRLASRSEEHTSELQSLAYLVCRLLLEKKKEGTGPAHDADAPGHLSCEV